MSQTNIQIGPIVLPAGNDLTGKEGYLVKIGNNSGKAAIYIADEPSDSPTFVLVEGRTAGELVTVLPLSPDRNSRVVLQGVCTPGDIMVPEDEGRIRALPNIPGTYRGIAFSEESGVDGQLIKIRPTWLGLITVSE